MSITHIVYLFNKCLAFLFCKRFQYLSGKMTRYWVVIKLLAV